MSVCQNSTMRAAFWYALRMAVAPFVAFLLGGADFVVLWFLIDQTIALGLQVRVSNKLGVRRALRRQPDAAAVAGLKALVGPVAGRLHIAQPSTVLPIDSVAGWENAIAIRSRRHGTTVLVSQRILGEAPPEAVAAGIAHELGHLRPFDWRLVSLAAYVRLWLPIALASASIVVPADRPAIVVAYVSFRLAIDLLSRGISRQCERRADAFAVSGGFGPDLARLVEWQLARRPRGWHMPPAWLSPHLQPVPRVALLSASAPGQHLRWSTSSGREVLRRHHAGENPSSRQDF
jgi:Zn-dependent protease with chaperone function